MVRKDGRDLDDLDNIEVAEAIDRYVRGERARAILKRSLIDKICLEPLAEEFDISVSTVKRDLYEAQKQFFKHFDWKEK